jgi:hypothetical protein
MLGWLIVLQRRQQKPEALLNPPAVGVDAQLCDGSDAERTKQYSGLVLESKCAFQIC